MGEELLFTTRSISQKFVANEHRHTYILHALRINFDEGQFYAPGIQLFRTKHVPRVYSVSWRGQPAVLCQLLMGLRMEIASSVRLLAYTQ